MDPDPEKEIKVDLGRGIKWIRLDSDPQRNAEHNKIQNPVPVS